MPAKRHVPRLILFLALAIPFSSLLSSCRDQPDATSALPSLPVLSVEAYWDWAHEAAREWHADALILQVYVKAELPNTAFGGPIIEFAFVSPEDRLTEFIFSCTAEGCKTFEIDRSPGHPSRICPFTLEDFKIDSKEALAIALDNGLEPYVSHETALIDLDLMRPVPCLEDVVWVASGFIPSPTQSTFVWIDAMTGEVIESPY